MYADGLEMTAVHRIEQLRHQRQSRALTVEVVVKHGLGHTADAMSP
jgi:hypothetical protein